MHEAEAKPKNITVKPAVVSSNCCTFHRQFNVSLVNLEER